MPGDDGAAVDALGAPGPPQREQALWLAGCGRADASVQQRVLRDLLDAGAVCSPGEVLGALLRQVAPPVPDQVRRLTARLRALSGRLVVIGDADYPLRLRDAWPELGAPVWLFAAGSQPPVDRRPAVAVVGTRAPTADGLATARALGAALARGGVTVVSGMARGIDQAAHRGALDGGGRTVAVLGTGLGVDYPGGSARLRSAVADAGALLTELAPGVGPRPWQFLARNRIISGLADATVVIEGREKSGALQTARLAAAQGRDVWAVPGSINAPASAAPLALLRDGALPVTGIDDFVEAVTGSGSGLGSGAGPGRGLDAPGVATSTSDTQAAVTSDAIPTGAPPVARALSNEASTVVALLGVVAASTDELAAATRLPVHAVLAAVGELVDAGVATITPQGVARSVSA